MKHKLYLLLTLIFLFVACNETSTEKKKLAVIKKESSHQNTIPKAEAIKIATIPKPPSKEYTFTFQDLQGQSSTLKMKDDIYSFSNIQQPIVMITLFSTWCPPCRGQIPHLSNLQKKFKKYLFIIGALVHDDIKDEAFQKFINTEKALFFISNNRKENLKFADMITPKLRLTKEFPMPLMILFFKGKYFTHYEGSMPEEMIESDIEQILKKLNK
ncbi:Putative lipoprotein thiredoxin [hydrothermal vent metagenome]|uniref:Putative lipoprotein thiredoxin n=1 Tax=hydrothermal vent metagenome TaxID=652676 RepID=A0A1W1BQH7_9ZZZZ